MIIKCAPLGGTRLKFESWKVQNPIQNASGHCFYCFLKEIWILKSGYSQKSPTHVLHYLLWRFRSQSTSLLLCCYALACGPNMAATLQAFQVEYYLWSSDWLTTLRWLPAPNPLWWSDGELKAEASLWSTCDIHSSQPEASMLFFWWPDANPSCLGLSKLHTALNFNTAYLCSMDQSFITKGQPSFPG